MQAYFDCFSGISGDMTLGAFVDLGVSISWLKNELSRMPLTRFDLAATPVFRHGIQATQVQVQVKGHSDSRDYSQIRSLINDSPLQEAVKRRSLSMFQRIADAEGQIHGQPADNVHFHEVGGVDAIVDVVGTALCVEYLTIKNVASSKIPLGRGFVSCAHGTLPVPAPATLLILKGIPVYGTDMQHELVTPTGAAIITSLADRFGEMPEMIVEKIGHGAGKRDHPKRPNLLRIITGRAKTAIAPSEETIGVVETCIDDMNPEFFGFIMERLFDSGAVDVYWIPVFMKKNRPGTLVQVLCPENRKKAVIRSILTETTSAGVRYYTVQRAKLFRERVTVKTPYGRVAAKRIQDPAGRMRIVPEYEVCRKIALEKKIPIRVVYDAIAKEAVLD